MRNTRRSCRLKLTRDELENIAANVCEFHAIWTDEGFQLRGQSGVWSRKDGGRTFRFVYRHRKKAQSMTFTARHYGGAML